MFVPIERDVYAWKVPDAEFGELMQGHVHLLEDGFILTDPPLMPDLTERLGVFGKCHAVIVLSHSHKRGSALASRMLDAPLYYPEFASSEGDIGLGVEPIYYKDGDILPGKLKTSEIKTEIGIFMEHPVHEMCLVDRKKRVFIADVCHGMRDGTLALAPEDIFPGYSEEQVKASFNALVKAVPSDVKSGFFGHGDDISVTFSARIHDRKAELKL